MNKQNDTNFSPWTLPIESLFGELHSSSQGLTSEEAHERLNSFGRNELVSREAVTPMLLFLEQFKTPWF